MPVFNRSASVIQAPETVTPATKSGAGGRVMSPGRAQTPVSVSRNRPSARAFPGAQIQNLSPIPVGRNAFVTAPPVLSVNPSAHRPGDAQTPVSVGPTSDREMAFNPRISNARPNIPPPATRPNVAIVAPQPSRMARPPAGVSSHPGREVANLGEIQAALEENARQHKMFADAIAQLQAEVSEANQFAAQALYAAKDGNNNLVALGQNAEAALDKIGVVLSKHEEALVQILRVSPETYTSRRQGRQGTPMERGRKRVITIEAQAAQGAALPDSPGVSSKNERISRDTAMSAFRDLGGDEDDYIDYE